MLRLLIFALLISIGCSSTVDAAQDYCSYSKNVIPIFVDRTTAYDEIDKEVFSSGFEKIFGALRLGDRVLVYTITGNYTENAKVFDRCVPGCPDVSMWDWLFGQCRALQARADLTAFKTELAQRIRSMLDDVQQFEHSDIVRTVARTIQRLSNSAELNGGTEKIAAVFIFSDLLENSEFLPWPRILAVDENQLFEIIREKDLLAVLDGADVIAFGIGRLHNPERTPLSPPAEQKLRGFWDAYFRLGGARHVYVGQRLE